MTIEMVSMRRKISQALQGGDEESVKMVAFTNEELSELLTTLPERLTVKQRGQAASRAVNRLKREHPEVWSKTYSGRQNWRNAAAFAIEMTAANKYMREQFPEEYRQNYEEEKRKVANGDDAVT